MLNQICLLARRAGDAIMDIYHHPDTLTISAKADNSPLTAADLAAHHIIVQELKSLTPDIPVLSEEDPQPWSERQHWTQYWLVDPLDGTKEFISRNGEFTVNIALISDGVPVMGVVYAPVPDVLYLAEGKHAWRERGGQRMAIKVVNTDLPMVVISRSHQDAELADYLEQLGPHETRAIGSSLKFCLVAEGKVQLYPRFNPTHIWDTAAGHAVALAAGAHITDWSGKTLDYTPRESLINPGFRVSSF